MEMERSVLILILINVLMTSLAQIVLKAGMSTEAVLGSIGGGIRLASVGTVFTSPYVILGLVMYFASAFIWLIVLSKVEVSLAYPFVGLGFIVTMVLGALVHGDAVGLMRVLGTLLVATGVVVLARS
jgi:multidrug transporter EmrE-like cation transporter